MNEKEKNVIWQIESMRDGCTREVLYNYFTKEELDPILNNFIENNYLTTTDDLLFINYEKISVNTWIDVTINE